MCHTAPHNPRDRSIPTLPHAASVNAAADRLIHTVGESWRMQHPLAQQIKTGSTIPLAFEQLEPIHMTLHSPVIPFDCERGFHCRVVTVNTSGNAFEFANGTCVRPIEPPSECAPSRACSMAIKSRVNACATATSGQRVTTAATYAVSSGCSSASGRRNSYMVARGVKRCGRRGVARG